VIRKANREDIDQIYFLGKKYDSNFDKLYNLSDYISNPIYLVYCYEHNGNICGFVIASILYEVIEILIIYVDAEYRNNGIASKLLLNLEKNNVDNLLLEVSCENHIASCLYEKLGYKKIGVRKKYYNGVDAYIMKKELR